MIATRFGLPRVFNGSDFYVILPNYSMIDFQVPQND